MFDERVSKELRLSIENSKVDTIRRFDSMNIKSPREWRDNLVNFRIRRKMLNRESSLTVQQREELYNGSNVSKEDMESLERVKGSPRRFPFKE